MSTAQVPALLRFLTQDAKVPLAVAIGKTPELQKANLTRWASLRAMIYSPLAPAYIHTVQIR